MLSDKFAQSESRLRVNPSHPRHNQIARAAVISTVDKEIDAARESVRSLLTHRNVLVPISLLPPRGSFVGLSPPGAQGTVSFWIEKSALD